MWFRRSMLIDRRAHGDVAIHIGDANPDSNAAIRALRDLDLIQVPGRIVIDRRPEERPQVAHIASRGRRRAVCESSQLLLDRRWEIRIEAVVNHLLAGGERKIEVEGRHRIYDSGWRRLERGDTG